MNINKVNYVFLVSINIDIDYLSSYVLVIEL